MIPAAENSDDAKLLRAAAQGDETAFAALYDRLARPVFALVVRIIGSRAEAEEVLQEAFVQVWERAPDFRAELGTAFCWVVTIARRKAIDRLRANSRHLHRIAQAAALDERDDLMGPAGAAELASDERSRAVHAALAKLGAPERHAIALAFFDGLTHEEIATALGTPVGTIKARIRRGMLKLKPVLKRLHHDGSE
jgi:RNA polymerase sigma-70 factor (ECF subfamily)